MQIICFEDDDVHRLSPITLARPAFQITCASLRLIGWLQRLAKAGKNRSLSVIVRPYLQTIQQLDFGLTPPTGELESGGVLLVNARLVPRVSLADALEKLALAETSIVVTDPQEGVVLAARITAKDLKTAASADAQGPLIAAAIARPRPDHSAPADVSLDVFRWPHDVISWHMKEMPACHELAIGHGDYSETADGIFVRPGVKIGRLCRRSTADDGPILLDENVQVGPFCFLSGPVYAGRRHTRDRTRCLERRRRAGAHR